MEVGEGMGDEGVCEEVAFIWSGGQINFLKSLCHEGNEFVEGGGSSDECRVVLDRDMREGERVVGVRSVVIIGGFKVSEM